MDINNVDELYYVLDRVYKGNLVKLINDLNDEGKAELLEIFDKADIGVRMCSHCKNLFISGFVIYDGEYYACSEECFSKISSDKELKELEDNIDYYDTDFSEVNEEGVELVYLYIKKTFNTWLDKFIKEKNLSLSKHIQLNNDKIKSISLKEIIEVIKEWTVYKQLLIKQELIYCDVIDDNIENCFASIVEKNIFDFSV